MFKKLSIGCLVIMILSLTSCGDEKDKYSGSLDIDLSIVTTSLPDYIETIDIGDKIDDMSDVEIIDLEQISIQDDEHK